mmetsp:Transcript_6648/g.18569  ORF Transcript_6648/g.18569 Transcript_6648/m.18569 type:complete len:93 (-) Transcript_6648:431-709(-)
MSRCHRWLSPLSSIVVWFVRLIDRCEAVWSWRWLLARLDSSERDTRQRFWAIYVKTMMVVASTPLRHAELEDLCLGIPTAIFVSSRDEIKAI